MDEQLIDEFNLWIGRYAVDGRIQIEEVPTHLGVGEIDNRNKHYPILGTVVNQRPVVFADFHSIAKQCWALRGRFDVIKLGVFASSVGSAAALQRLIEDFPADDWIAAKRIDSFIEECFSLG